MNKYMIVILFVFLGFISMSQEKFEVSSDTEKEIDEILAELSLIEKVGQTCQITLDALLAVGENGKPLEPHQLDPAKFNEALCEYRVGSILNVSSHTLGLEEWNTIMTKVNDAFLKRKITIPIMYGIDAIHGVNYTKGATLFPQEIGLAATWNRNLAERFGEITAYETRASGLRWNFSPVLDVARQPLWSRYFETLGEDPYLISRMGESIITGYQGTNSSSVDNYHVASCLKHFVGYSVPTSGRDRTSAWIPKKYMTELYLPPFKAAVDRGAMTLMINSGDVNGVPGHVNKALLTDLLKNDWGFQGFTVSDWEDFIMLESVHNVGTDLQDAIVKGFNAGVDMSMVPNRPNYMDYCELLVKSVEEGKVSLERLDDAVRRILRVKMATGLYDKKTYKEENYSLFGSQEFKNAAKESALESITLLKNKNALLPLKKESKVLVAGPTSNDLIFINGGWTHTWQGVETTYNTLGCETIYEAIANKIGSENCPFSQGAELSYVSGWEQAELKDIADFKAKAAISDVIVLCIGELPSTEKPGDIRSLRMLEAQTELAEIAYATGKPVVLVLVEARPRTIHSIVDQAGAIVQTYLPGDYGGSALADILFGDENPSGKLPYTYPKYDGVVEFYDHPKSTDRSGKNWQFDAFDPEWEFGFGLSYTTFEYSDFKIDRSTLGVNDELKISVTVKNSGTRSGKEVVQLYLSDLKASMVPSGKKLCRFDKIELAPQESKNVEFILSLADLMFADQDGSWIYESGEFQVEINKEVLKFELK